MQILIIDAIAEVGEPATFDQILQSVSSRWRGIKIRRRDGTPYTTDCRRAIQANLRTNPHQVSLFVRAATSDGTVAWRFSQSIEEAEEAKLKSKSEKVKETKPSEEAGKKSADPLDGAETSSDNESHPMSPDTQEYTRSLRPVRASRHSGALEDFLGEYDDERYESSGMRYSGRPRRDSSSSSYTESYSLDSSFLRSKQQIRRENMDESDIPPAKRFSVGSLDAELLAGAGVSSSGHYSHSPHTSPSVTTSQSAMQGTHVMEWTPAMPSERPASSANSNSAMALNMPAVLNLSALPPMQHMSESSIANAERFQGWIPPSLFGYYQPQAAAAAAAAYGAGMPNVPQFLPHQMSLAHEKAQQLATSDFSSPGAWSDRSALSRQSMSSSRTSTSTMPDQSPRTPHSLSNSNGMPNISAGVHPAFAALPPAFHLYSPSPNAMAGITPSPVHSSLSSHPAGPSNGPKDGAVPSFLEGTLSH
jgi:hypothetical protein